MKKPIIIFNYQNTASLYLGERISKLIQLLTNEKGPGVIAVNTTEPDALAIKMAKSLAQKNPDKYILLYGGEGSNVFVDDSEFPCSKINLELLESNLFPVAYKPGVVDESGVLSKMFIGAIFGLLGE